MFLIDISIYFDIKQRQKNDLKKKTKQKLDVVVRQ